MQIVANRMVPLAVESHGCMEAWRRGESYEIDTQEFTSLRVKIDDEDVVALFDSLIARELRPARLAKILKVCVKGISRLPLIREDANRLNRSVEHLGLSPRSQQPLLRANILTVGELVQKTEMEVRLISNIGRKSLNEIREVLSALGLSLAASPRARKRLAAGARQ